MFSVRQIRLNSGSKGILIILREKLTAETIRNTSGKQSKQGCASFLIIQEEDCPEHVFAIFYRYISNLR